VIVSGESISTHWSWPCHSLTTEKWPFWQNLCASLVNGEESYEGTNELQIKCLWQSTGFWSASPTQWRFKNLKSRGGNINVYLTGWFVVVLKIKLLWLINPIKPNIGLWISLNVNQCCYSVDKPTRHCRCNHTRVLLCRIFCANHATSTALRMWNETLFSVHNCADLTWTKTAPLKNSSQLSEIWFQPRIPSWRRDK